MQLVPRFQVRRPPSEDDCEGARVEGWAFVTRCCQLPADWDKVLPAVRERFQFSLNQHRLLCTVVHGQTLLYLQREAGTPPTPQQVEHVSVSLLQELMDNMARLRVQQNQLQAEQYQLHKQNQQLHKQNQQLLEETKVLLQNNKELRKDIDELRTSSVKRKATIGTLKTTVGTLKTKVGTLETTVSKLETTVGKLETTVGKLETTVANLTATVATLQQDMANLRAATSTQLVGRSVPCAVHHHVPRLLAVISDGPSTEFMLGILFFCVWLWRLS
ncbi:uncharacterized protein LOC129596565 isoform X1 [Paramacrobiotus metropolitanus]|uniref:uncharacterized protein LOC129596565 isoform X1 n=1 Tax=Paramacrobiotus metropolitanus TaxID=2943436 RepID=UPI002446298A|nr:uncharacterized protein LOC129596565 isoform X1 [Paramacrobiotus metropolitanus]